MKKIISFLLLFAFVNIFFINTFVFAQIDSPLPGAPQLQGSEINSLFDRAKSNQIGVTCGLPEGINRKEGTQCCNTNINNDDLMVEPLKRAPEYFCLPEALSKGVGGIGGFLGGVLSAPFKAFGSGIGVLTNLFQGKFGDAAGSLLNVAKAGSGFDTIKSTVEGLNTDKICLSDAVKLMYINSLSANPLLGMKKPDTPAQPCIESAQPTMSDYASPSCKCQYSKEDELGVTKLCRLYMQGSRDKQICETCASSGGYWTGIGCIKTDLAGFVQSTLGLGISIAGATAFLCILYAAFVLQTSRGNPERIKKAREYLNSCLIGLAIIIFSIFILRIVGVDILGIPGFGP